MVIAGRASGSLCMPEADMFSPLSQGFGWTQPLLTTLLAAGRLVGNRLLACQGALKQGIPPVCRNQRCFSGRLSPQSMYLASGFGF